MIIIGIDPGSKSTGYGIVEKKADEIRFIACGNIRPSGKLPFAKRIFEIFTGISRILEEYKPDEVAVEDLFHSKNAKSSLKLGHVRGAIISAILLKDLPIFEYTPLEIKKAVVGYGAATKEQVKSMVSIILKLNEDISFDSSDALAVAICHANSRR